MIIITSSSKAASKIKTLSEPAWPTELMRVFVTEGLYTPWETLERTPATTPPENSAQTLAQITINMSPDGADDDEIEVLGVCAKGMALEILQLKDTLNVANLKCEKLRSNITFSSRCRCCNNAIYMQQGRLPWLWNEPT